MMLSSLPSNRNDAVRRESIADLPLHQRLFGNRSLLFYLFVGAWLAFMATLHVATLVQAPGRALDTLGLLALPVFVLLSGSPSRRIQAIALGIMGGLIWSHLAVGPLLVAVAAVTTGLVNYVCAALVNHDLEALDGLTRRQRRPVLTRLALTVFMSWASVAAPGGLIVHSYLVDRGWSAETATYLVGGGLVFLAFTVWRRLADEIPGPVDGKTPTGAP